MEHGTTCGQLLSGHRIDTETGDRQCHVCRPQVCALVIRLSLYGMGVDGDNTVTGAVSCRLSKHHFTCGCDDTVVSEIWLCGQPLVIWSRVLMGFKAGW